MKIKSTFLVVFFLILVSFNLEAHAKKDAVLIFSLTKGYHHASIAEGLNAFRKLGAENNFTVDTTTDVSPFAVSNLKKYKAIIFLSPTGSNLFNDEQKAAFKQHINSGGGFVGIHAATDVNYEWAWYGQLVGAFFEKHPKIQNARLNILLPKNKINRGLPQPWMHKDEWYNFKDLSPNIKILINIDETSYTGGTMSNNHPISWCQEFEGGRVFYTALGHTKECYTDPLFLGHVLAGLKWAMK